MDNNLISSTPFTYRIHAPSVVESSGAAAPDVGVGTGKEGGKAAAGGAKHRRKAKSKYICKAFGQFGFSLRTWSFSHFQFCPLVRKFGPLFADFSSLMCNGRPDAGHGVSFYLTVSVNKGILLQPPYTGHFSFNIIKICLLYCKALSRRRFISMIK